MWPQWIGMTIAVSSAVAGAGVAPAGVASVGAGVAPAPRASARAGAPEPAPRADPAAPGPRGPKVVVALLNPERIAVVDVRSGRVAQRIVGPGTLCGPPLVVTHGRVVFADTSSRHGRAVSLRFSLRGEPRSGGAVWLRGEPRGVGAVRAFGGIARGARRTARRNDPPLDLDRRVAAARRDLAPVRGARLGDPRALGWSHSGHRLYFADLRGRLLVHQRDALRLRPLGVRFHEPIVQFLVVDPGPPSAKR